jgi:AraC-like DNA-binding protein
LRDHKNELKVTKANIINWLFVAGLIQGMRGNHMLKQCLAILASYQAAHVTDAEMFERSVNRLMEKRHLVSTEGQIAIDSAWLRLPYSGVGVVHHRSENHVVFEEKARSAQLLIPLQGEIEDCLAQQTFKAGQAKIIAPGDAVELLWRQQCLAIVIRVDETTLGDFIAKLYPERQRLIWDLPRQLDLTQANSASLSLVLNMLVEELANSDSMLQTGITARLIDELLLTTWLHVSMDTDRQASLSHRPYIQHAALRRAVNYIYDHLSEAIALSAIAVAAEVGQRSLQKQFEKHFGVSPMRFVRREKLKQVRHALLQSTPEEEHVGDVAARWGFFHTGHFARIYQQEFGESPSATLTSHYT